MVLRDQSPLDRGLPGRQDSGCCSRTVEGCRSPVGRVQSGVPQGTVLLVPLLFLLHINDLPNCHLLLILLSVSLLMIASFIAPSAPGIEDQDILQGDLDSLERLSDISGMKFNPVNAILCP